MKILAEPTSATCRKPDSAAGPIEFSVQSLPPLSALEPFWTELDRVGDHGFFVSWIWIGAWLHTLPGTLQPRLLTATLAGRPVAAAILVPRQVRRRSLVSASQWHFNSTGVAALDAITIEHNTFAGSAALVPRLWRALPAWFEGEAGTEELIVPGLDTEACTLLNENRGSLLVDAYAQPAFRTKLAGLAGSVETVLSRNARQQLRRSLRRYDALGRFEVREAESAEQALVWFDRLRQFHIASWSRRGRRHAFSDPYFEAFHRRLIADGFSRGAVQLLSIRAGGSPVGYLYNFRHRSCIYAYQSGFADRTDMPRPGYVSHYLAMEHNASRGAQDYDFLAGDNRLKRSFASEQYSISWHALRRRKLKFQLENTARRLAGRAAS